MDIVQKFSSELAELINSSGLSTQVVKLVLQNAILQIDLINLSELLRMKEAEPESEPKEGAE